MIASTSHGADGSILELRLDRPPANALSPELLVALDDAVRTAPERGFRAIVLSGAEGMFSAGLDVPRFLELDRSEVQTAWESFFRLMATLAGSQIPLAAALTGHAPAGGCVLALCCDYRVFASGRYRIGLNEVQVGVRVPLPIFAAATHVVGRRQAERMATTAELFDDDEALRIGLVDAVVPIGDVVPTALEWAERMIALPPATLRKTRALCRRELMRSFRAVDEEQLELFLDEWFGDECQTALRTLVAKLAAKGV